MSKQKSWTLSGEWLQRVLDIMDCLGDANYNYYDYDLDEVRDPTAGTKRVTKFFAIRVEVEKRYRVRASEFIKKTIEGKEITGHPGEFYKVELGGKNKDNVNDLRIDMTVGNAPARRFHIIVKPNAAAGSGGGAAETAINESYQALYAAYAFRHLNGPINENQTINLQDLRDCYDKYCHVDVDFDELYFPDAGWQPSHIRGANRLWKEYGTNASGKDYHFYRGSGFDDGEIKQAFLRCKKNMGDSKTTFSSEDKWNPADIWIASRDFDPKELSKKESGKFVINNIDKLNKFLVDKYNSNDLFGISLKKIKDANPTFSKRNLDLWDTRIKNFDKYGFKNQNSTSNGGIEVHFKNKNEYPMDVYLYFHTGKYDKFQARNFAGDNKGSWQIELKGVGAAQGRVGGGQVAKILADAGERYPGLTNLNNTQMWSRCNKKHTNKNWRDSTTHLIEKLLKKYNAMGMYKVCSQNNAMIAQQSTSWRYAKLLSLMLLDCIAKSNQSDRLMQELYIYASSQSDKSGPHVKME